MAENEYQANFTSGFIKSPYDKRDYNFKQYVPLQAIDIPKNYESDQMDFIYDQQKSSECCACAFNSLRYLQESKQTKLNQAFSPTYTYGSRDPLENYEGMYIRNCLKKARTAGSILYSELPGFYSVNDSMKLVNRKKADYLIKGEPYRISGFYVCRSREAMQTAIITCMGIMTGIPVFDSLYDVTSDGVVNYDPNRDIKDNGGHCILITGWKTDKDDKLWWRCLNSWGANWGDNGYFWLPEEYPLIEDCFTATDEIIEMTFEEYRQKFYS